ncbi:heme peroxidase [Moniliophthora roreri]|uniref:Putative heme peroxidase n=1 Tax=Moniliophthora roreri TaxID=221103 RepID=A0A0W0FVA0_MONRR|nr:heme peroxidase [Moniliophthora roreri]
MALNISPLEKFALASDAVYLKGRPLPTAPDGKYDPPSQEPGQKQERSALGGIFKRLDAQAKKGLITPDPTVVAGFLDTVLHPDATDDRKGAFSAGLTLLSRLPPNSDAAKKMSDGAVGLLYNTLPHPPETLLGPQYSFRQADGGNNNIQVPSIGRAGEPYARSVQGKWCVSPQDLPDPALVYDILLRRRKVVEHPNGNASFTFAFASLVTHSLFRSRMGQWHINDTSSYLDLSPLYGINQETVDAVRNKDLGRGLLYPDTFSEERLLFLPPCASALLVILSRNHNYIAEKLLKINERGRWTDPPPEDKAKRDQQDEEIFQTARLINGGHFMSLIMGDYVAGFLGLSEGNAWNMNAFDPIKINDVEVKRGEGNHCSVEFNILYRWHATTSEADAKWINDFFASEIPSAKSPEDITFGQFAQTFVRKLEEEKKKAPKDREFGGMKRGPDGHFSDDELANILHTATENPACSFGAHGTPDALKIIEIMGINQARQWGLCTMNEFRKFLGLKQFETFEEWNPDPAVAGPARRLYKHIDNLELYTGLQCESLMPLSGGLRFACGYTTTRAVLSDAIALIRGDRFYTTAFTPANLTTWGYQDCLRDPNNGGFGGEMPKLLSRHLPRHYPYNSVYTCFPYFTPKKMHESLTRLQLADKYTFERPKPAPVVKVLNTMQAIKYVFSKPTEYPVVYDMKGLGGGYGFMLTFDEATKHDADRNLALHALFPTKDSLNEYRKWYRDQVTLRIRERSWKYDGVPGRFVDIVNDVINSTSIAWASERLCGLDMKTKENPSGMYTEAEIYEMFTTMFTLIFLAIGDNEHGFSLRKQVLQAGGVTQAMIAKNVFDCAPKAAGASNVFLGALSTVASTVHSVIDNKPCYAFLRRLAETGRPINEIVAMVVGLAVGSSVNYAQAAVHVIDFYMAEERKAERAEIIKLSQSKDSEGKGWDTLVGYVREAMRLNPQVTGLYRDALVDAVISQGSGLPDIQLKKGDRIFGSLKNAHLNPDDFPDPLTINPTRPASAYQYNGSGFHQCPGVNYAEQTIAEIVKVVFSLPNIRRAPGNDGKLAGFEEIQNETKTKVYVTPDGETSPWPGKMYLVYDA